MKRGNPVEQLGKHITLSQGVGHPVGDSANTDIGNPAALRVPQNKSNKIIGGVGSPSVGASRSKSDVPARGKTKRP